MIGIYGFFCKIKDLNGYQKMVNGQSKTKNGKNMSKYQRLHIDRFNVNCQKNYKIYIK